MATRAQRSSGWMADLSLGFKLIEGKTVLSHRERKGPLAVQRSFYPESGVCHVYVLHPPGGVVGGDTLTVKTDLADRAEALITTPGATKFYRSAGSVAKQIQILSLSKQACLE
ncbi:MAG: urease accessory protein UreD, partial [Pseudomonadota bacterium]|nr:urease accessory protein UreD [Pseudomonadota bacterium]